MSFQSRLPGTEEFFISKNQEWNPRPGTMAAVKSYFDGFAAHGREIYAKRKYIAARLKMTVRTLARYLKYLSDTGWMGTIRRTARSAHRKVFQQPAQDTVPSPVPSHLSTEVPSEEETTATPLPAKIHGILKRAADRIRKAANPAAYRQAIISCELRLMAWKAQQPPKPPPKAEIRYTEGDDKRALSNFLGWALK